MNWTFNGVRVFVDKYGGQGKQIIPALQPLRGGTVYQFYGYETETKQISGLIVGTVDLHSLVECRETASAYLLETPLGIAENMYLKDIKYNMEKAVYQTLRPDLDCDEPIFSVDLELIPSGISQGEIGIN